MEAVNVGIIGLGNVGMGTLAILAENAGQIGLSQVIRRRLATGRAKKRTTDMSLSTFSKLFLP